MIVMVNWLDGLSPRDVSHPASLFMEAFRDSFLVQHVKDPTHYRAEQTPNVLDLIFTSEEDMVGDVRHLAPLGKSHHQSLLFEIKCYTDKKKNDTNRFNFAKGNYDRLRTLVGEAVLEQKIKDMNTCQAWSTVKGVVFEAMNHCIPKLGMNRTKKKVLWMKEEVAAKIKAKKQAYRKYLDTRDGSDYLTYTKARNQAKNACRKAIRDYEKTVAHDAKRNPKRFFAYVRSKLNTKDSVADLNDNGCKVSSDDGKANVLNRFFSSVFTTENLTNLPSCEEKHFSSCLSDVVIDSADVARRLLALDPNKSPGPDGFHPRLLKELAQELSPSLSLIFEKSLLEGVIPDDWKDAQVTPLFKKGEKANPSNYRPVSLTSIVCKLMESIIRDKVMQHLSENDLLTNCQHGFVAGRSCTTNLLSTLEDWTSLLDIGVPVDAVYLDFSKAFDSVPHERLLIKLKALGIEGQALGWIRAFLNNRRQRVCVNGVLSDWAAVTSGVPQGSVLGPVLFVAYINDLPDVVECHCSMYADDTKVYNRVETEEEQQQLQSDINSLVDWADAWQLCFNADKCKVLHLGKQNSRLKYSMRKHGSHETLELKESEIERDLGVNVDASLKFSQHVEIQVNKANRLLGLIRRSFVCLDSQTMKMLFTAIVRPHLEFANAAWSPVLERDKRLIEGVLRRATKLVHGLKNLPYEARLRDMNIPSMTYRKLRGDLIECYKVTHHIYKLQDCLLELSSNFSTRGHNYKLEKKRCNTTLRQKFFTQRVVDRWNRLPAQVVEAPCVNTFKNNLDRLMQDYSYSLVEPPTVIRSDQKISNFRKVFSVGLVQDQPIRQR